MPFSPRPIGCRPLVVRPVRVHPPMELDGLADIAALISVLGGNTVVSAFYDVRAGVTATTTVSQWDDARGATGFGPSLVQATSGNRPAWDPSALTMSFDGIDDTLATVASPLFALATPMSLAFVGSVQVLAAASLAMAVTDQSVFTRLFGIRHTGTGAGVLTGQLQNSILAGGTVVASTTRRLIVVGTDGLTTISLDIPSVARVAGVSGVAAAATGNNILTIGNTFTGRGEPALLAVRAALCISRQVTAGDVTTLLAWAQANHGAVAA